MSSIFNKLRDFVSVNEPEEDPLADELDEREMETASYSNQQMTPPLPNEPQSRYSSTQASNRFSSESRESTTPSSKSNVIGMPGTNNSLNEIIVFEPHSFEKMPEVIQALRERKTVVLNLNMMEPDDAQRAVDFVAGGTYAIDGHQERIGESIFLFTPNSVNVSTESDNQPSLTSGETTTSQSISQMSAPAQNWEDSDELMAQ